MSKPNRKKSPKEMNERKKTIIWMAVSALILLPVLFFPLGTDHCIYLKGGKILMEGGTIYSDFIDLKPPFLYYVYGVIGKIFTDNPLGIRTFDLLFQLLTCYLLYRLVRRESGNTLAAGLSSVIYAVVLTAQGNPVSFTQGIFAITAFIVVLLLVRSEQRGVFSFVAAGAVIGLVTGLKYTYGILLAGVIFDDILRERKFSRELIKRNLLVTGGFAVAFLLTLFPLLDSTVRANFGILTEYLSLYVSSSPLDFSFVKQMYVKLGNEFGYHITLPVVISSVACVFFYFKNFGKLSQKERGFIETIILFGGLLFLSILIERRFTYYIFMRLYPVFAVLSGLFLSLLLMKIRSEKHQYTVSMKITVSVVILGTLIFGPGVRYLNRVKMGFNYLTAHEKYVDSYSFDEVTKVNMRNILELGRYFEKAAEEFSTDSEEKPLLLNVQTGMVMLDLITPSYRHSVFGHSQFYVSEYSPDIWRKMFFDEVKEAEYIMMAKWDYNQGIFGYHNIPDMGWTSYSFFFDAPYDYSEYVSEYIENNYIRVKNNKRYVVFRRSRN